jgi:hypothetical protein
VVRKPFGLAGWSKVDENGSYQVGLRERRFEVATNSCMATIRGPKNLKKISKHSKDMQLC